MKEEELPPQPDPIDPDLVARAAQSQPRVVERFRALATALDNEPPQVLLLEGGDEPLRRAMAMYWAALLNCSAEPGIRPCLACESCLKLMQFSHRDLFFLDGADYLIKIAHVRYLRSVLGEPTREARYRVCILAEAPNMQRETANALLKSLEEPRPGNSFLLLAPQRERLLPTLVSRSWPVTLSWPRPDRESAPETLQWMDLLAGFLRSGQGLFQRTGTKSAVDKDQALDLILAMQRELRAVLTGGGLTNLGARLASLPPQTLRTLDLALAQSQEALNYGVNPALVVERLAVRLHSWA